MVRVKKQKSENTTRVSSKDLKDIEELVLPASKLKFCSKQLQNLNYIFTRKLEQKSDPEHAKTIALAKSVTERLLQRLLCGAGLQDSKFVTKFLIALNDNNSDTKLSLDYIIRLDSLSTPVLYSTDEVPRYTIIEGEDNNKFPSYAKIRLHPSCVNDWKQYTNSKGFLRRDKIQSKMVELLANAASCETPRSPLHIDESVLCGSPGKIVDPVVLNHILHIPAEQQVFYGTAGNSPRFPDPRDFKIAIVDDPTGIRIRVGFHSPALSSITIDVRLLVAIAFEAWPSTSNFPLRVPLGHSDCLLYYGVAQTGLYLTGYGVHSTAWQIRLPAAEFTLDNNYSQISTVNTILQTLYEVLQEIHDDCRQHQISYKILTAYSMRTILWYHLENDFSTSTNLILNWSQKYISTHVLKILDNLVDILKTQHQPNYFFPSANLLSNPGHLGEDDFILESNKVKAIMLRFFDESLISLKTNKKFSLFVSYQKSEMALLHKWKDLIDGLMPPPSTRGRRICFSGSKYKKEVVYTQYTTRQLEYISLALKNMLLVRQNILLANEDISWIENFKFLDLEEDPVEDIVYILVTLIEQARDKYLESIPEVTSKHVDKIKLKKEFEAAAAKLIELVRKEKEITDVEYVDDTTMVKIILKWLYKGLDYNKKNLAPVLRPYLRTIFVASHGASWHLEAIKKQDVQNELKALSVFSKLVNNGNITPAQGLIDSVSKNWNWAKSMLKIIEAENLRLIFTPFRNKTFRHILALPANSKKHKSLGCLQIHCNRLNRSLPLRHSLNSFITKSHTVGDKCKHKFDEFIPAYVTLKQFSPLTLTLKQLYRLGEHRCCGNIFDTLLAMQKFNILQEVSTLLPYEERLQILESIQKLTNGRGRQTFNKKKSNTFVQLSNSKRKVSSEAHLENRQKYTPKEESAGIREVITIDITSMPEGRLTNTDRLDLKKTYKNDKSFDESLIGSCRATRIREDTNIIHFEEYFKTQSMKKQPSSKH